MHIPQKLYERLLSMAQIHNLGVLQRGPNMVWTCRWNEDGRESSICYQVLQNPYDQSLKLRLRYRVLPSALMPEAKLDYYVPITLSRSYKGKQWYWFVCPLVINGKACRRRVRNLYFLPNSNYFGCKHCRDMMVRNLRPTEPWTFRQTQYLAVEEKVRGGASPELRTGWKPPLARQLCRHCGCLSEGKFCSNCGISMNGAQEEDFFTLLGVGTEPTLEELHLAFKNRLKEYHPDRVAHMGKKLRDLAEAEIKRVTQAYAVLRDPDRRVEYLRDLENENNR